MYLKEGADGFKRGLMDLRDGLMNLGDALIDSRHKCMYLGMG